MSSTADCRMISTSVPQNSSQKVPHFTHTSEYIKDGTETLVVLERPLLE